jgi:serralysin
VKLLVFVSSGSRFGSPQTWYDSGVGNWAASRTKLVAGDFTGDGKADVAAMYDYGGSHMKLWLFVSSGSRFGSPRSWYDSGVGNWASSRSKLVAGDFTGDRKSDVAVMYDYGGSRVKLLVFVSAGSTFAHAVSWYDSGVGAWAASRSKLVTGNFTGDRKADVAVMYDYGGSRMKLWLFVSSGSRFGSPQSWYDSGVGTWAASRSKLVAGDFTGDHKADVAVMYDYGGSRVKLWLLASSGSRFGSPQSWYDSGVGTWASSRTKLVAGDFTGDRRADIGDMYDYGGSHIRLHVFVSSGSTFAHPLSWYDSGVGNWASSRSTLTA